MTYNPHYSPFDLTGGIDWVRDLVAAKAAA